MSTKQALWIGKEKEEEMVPRAIMPLNSEVIVNLIINDKRCEPRTKYSLIRINLRTHRSRHQHPAHLKGEGVSEPCDPLCIRA